MKKEIPELKRLELNKQNVMKVLFDCKATESSKKTFDVSFYSNKSSRKAPKISFDEEKLINNIGIVQYLLGQLQGVHKRKDPLTPGEGIINYKGEKWTDDNRALFALYYLGCASSSFPRFIDGKNNAETDNISAFYDVMLKPTFAPSDPNFKLENARKALKNLGVKLPEDITHLD